MEECKKIINELIELADRVIEEAEDDRSCRDIVRDDLTRLVGMATSGADTDVMRQVAGDIIGMISMAERDAYLAGVEDGMELQLKLIQKAK